MPCERIEPRSLLGWGAMSFQDPDQREAWAKRAEQDRERCRKAGRHEYVGSGDRCVVCSAASPDSIKPRITLATPDYRAIHNPQTGNVTIEKRSTDILGADRWDHVASLSNTHSRSEPSSHHLIELLTKGARP